MQLIRVIVVCGGVPAQEMQHYADPKSQSSACSSAAPDLPENTHDPLPKTDPKTSIIHLYTSTRELIISSATENMKRPKVTEDYLQPLVDGRSPMT